ncbi:MAG: DUF6314 family protein [Pseudomonadota bacterium]
MNTEPRLGPVMRRFAGEWHLRRDITDLDSRWQGRLVGKAWFFRTGDLERLDYLEEGLLTFAGLKEVTATRRYIWRFPSRDRIDVSFEDDRPFHSFNPLLPEDTADHVCAADLYEVRYLFHDEAHWTAEWRVEGPRKDYRTVTRYRRALEG